MRLKIGSTYQKAVTIIEKLKEGNASIFICGKSGTGKTTLSSNITIFDICHIAPPIYIVYFIFSQWNVAICRKIKLYNSYFPPCTEKRAIL